MWETVALLALVAVAVAAVGVAVTPWLRNLCERAQQRRCRARYDRIVIAALRLHSR